jgi:hypothetical protein
MTDTRLMVGVLVISTPTLPSSVRSYNYNTIYDNVYFYVGDFCMSVSYTSLHIKHITIIRDVHVTQIFHFKCYIACSYQLLFI